MHPVASRNSHSGNICTCFFLLFCLGYSTTVISGIQWTLGYFVDDPDKASMTCKLHQSKSFHKNMSRYIHLWFVNEPRTASYSLLLRAFIRNTQGKLKKCFSASIFETGKPDALPVKLNNNSLCTYLIELEDKDTGYFDDIYPGKPDGNANENSPWYRVYKKNRKHTSYTPFKTNVRLPPQPFNTSVLHMQTSAGDSFLKDSPYIPEKFKSLYRRLKEI